MNITDFIIGLTLMNAMPHFILGIWKGKMLSGFGTGNKQNILWGLGNFAISVTLFFFRYGLKGFIENQIYLGGVVLIVTFFFTAPLWKKYYDRNDPDLRL